MILEFLKLSVANNELQPHFCPKELLVNHSLNSKRSEWDDALDTAKSFKSWSTCMDNKACKIIVIVLIVIGSIIAIWIIGSLLRMLKYGVSGIFEFFCWCYPKNSRNSGINNDQMYPMMYNQQPQQNLPVPPTVIYQPIKEPHASYSPVRGTSAGHQTPTYYDEYGDEFENHADINGYNDDTTNNPSGKDVLLQDSSPRKRPLNKKKRKKKANMDNTVSPNQNVSDGYYPQPFTDQDDWINPNHKKRVVSDENSYEVVDDTTSTINLPQVRVFQPSSSHTQSPYGVTTGNNNNSNRTLGVLDENHEVGMFDYRGGSNNVDQQRDRRNNNHHVSNYDLQDDDDDDDDIVVYPDFNQNGNHLANARNSTNNSNGQNTYPDFYRHGAY
ncbi:Pin2p SCDLUD_002911 [Saccharomycodes ludwigii]|uniref:Pin2p n=1 Tax=Saccharomycodes ludwigii TaxID=36035 RepID=UPI001E845307|nr:hypothetical protein SCDLUD_002911 [Saccharomycodes ludwigii]KAH3901419.1 hypothetical protein SCDLUD_002911 [Saccharomycodes ludwigii]